MYDFYADALVWIKNLQGRYCWGNQTLLLNFTIEDVENLIGKTDYDLVPPSIADLYVADDLRVHEGDRVIGRIEPLSGYEGLPRWAVTWKYPLADASRRIVGTLGMSRPLPAYDEPDFPFPELVPALKRMRHSFDDEYDHVALAKLCGMSARALERKFKAHFGMTPAQVRSLIRATRAAEQICNTTMPLADVAHRFGFSDQSHMTREFKKFFGITPNEYRLRHRRT